LPNNLPVTLSSKKSLRIALIATGGGHLRELIAVRRAYQHHDYFLISTPESRASSEVNRFSRQYFIWNTGAGSWRSKPFRFMRDLIHDLMTFHRVFLLEQPHCIISTGSGIAVPGFLIARLQGVPTIYIESYARIHSLSLTGRICYHLSDLFLVQHRDLAKQFRRAIYSGTVYENLPESTR
jgi:beta-1,4-N-acetylglucosaminyltransferase